MYVKGVHIEGGRPVRTGVADVIVIQKDVIFQHHLVLHPEPVWLQPIKVFDDASHGAGVGRFQNFSQQG